MIRTVAVILVVLTARALAYATVRRRGAHIGFILLAGGVFCFELLWAYPATAVDIFAYVADGQLLALHGANPFVVAPNATPPQMPSPPLQTASAPYHTCGIWSGVVMSK